MDDRTKLDPHLVLDLAALPPVPEAFARIWELSEDRRRGTQDLARLVGSDPALAAELLRTVNSAHYGLSHPIASIMDAITFVGVRRVKHLALSLSVRGGLLRRTVPEHFDPTGFWRHCVHTAFAADGLAHALQLECAQAAYVAGLLHDVGIMALDALAPDLLEDLIARLVEGTTLSRVEMEVLGCTHAAIGQRISELWRFPPAIGDAIAYHHEPSEAAEPYRPLACIVCLADALASPSVGTCYSAAEADRVEWAARYLDLAEPVIDAIREQALASVETLTEVLRLET
ncbi:MAG: HDOD domain-containing protein [Candidatus Eiseniibacteriota bacterium]